MAREAGGAGAAHRGDPLDADAVVELDAGESLGAGPERDHVPDAFVAAYLARGRGERERCPAVRHDAEVGVAHAGVRAAEVSGEEGGGEGGRTV